MFRHRGLFIPFLLLLLPLENSYAQMSGPPVITQQPKSVVVPENRNRVVLQVKVSEESGSVTYQWRKNGQNISGARSSSLIFFASPSEPCSVYDVVVGNAQGTVTSQGATVSVITSPQFTRQPQSKTVNSCERVTLEVNATSSDPSGIAYTWFRNNEMIHGAESASFSFIPTPADNGAVFHVEAENVVSRAVSRQARLTVRNNGPCDVADPNDRDGDGVNDVQELFEGTDPDDRGDYVEHMGQYACVLPNGFLQQMNIATVINHDEEPLQGLAEYRDQNGVLKASLEFTLQQNQKFDIILNGERPMGMGLESDTIGSFCVFTNTTQWSGGLAVYKPRADQSGSYDYVLYYPFAPPQRGVGVVSLNTNSLGGVGHVYNWIRVADAIVNDGKGLSGRVVYYDIFGQQIGEDFIDLVDGGRIDLAGHEQLGPNQVGLAKFIPDSNSDEYYFETTRYFHEELETENFFSAFAMPKRPATGALITGWVAHKQDEYHIVEVVNVTREEAQGLLEIVTQDGSARRKIPLVIPAYGSLHYIVTEDDLPLGTTGFARISGPSEALSTVTLSYELDQDGNFLSAYATAFGQSPGGQQISEFNTFIQHNNDFELFNDNPYAMTAQVEVIDYTNASLESHEFTLEAYQSLAHAFSTLPTDSYGTLVINAPPSPGLRVRNKVSRTGEYVLTFVGK